MAWTSIQQEEDQLNLDAGQKRQVANQVKKYDETIEARLTETYCHLIVPSQQGTSAVEWIYTRLQGSEGLVERASRRLVRDEELITQWSPATLRIELDRWLWKEQQHLSVKQLWEYLASYLYLPRLRNESVLIDAIRSGVGSLTWGDYFAYASAVREEGDYVGLIAGSLPSVTLDSSSVIVKPEAAQKQSDEERRKAEEVTYETQKEAGGETRVNNGVGVGQEVAVGVVTEKAILRRFHGAVELDPMRLGRDAGRIADEVISHLEGLVGSEVNITLEISVDVGEGIPENVVRIVSENCNTLKFKTHGFEE